MFRTLIVYKFCSTIIYSCWIINQLWIFEEQRNSIVEFIIKFLQVEKSV